MQTKEYKSLGLKVNLSVPTSVDEFDQNAKKEGACLTEAINNVIYRGSLATFRDTFLHGQKAEAAADGKPAVEEIVGVDGLTGIERATEPVLGKDKKPVVKDGETVTKYSESEGDYFDRVLATLVQQGKFTDDEAALNSFQSLADKVASSIAFDASASERKPTGPKKLAAKYKLTAAKVITLGTVDKTNGLFQTSIGKQFTATGDTTKMYTGTYPGTDGKDVSFSVSDKDAEALGWLVKEYGEWKAAQATGDLA